MTVPEDTLTPPSPPHLTRRSWRPLVARLHFYAGVLVAPFILVAAITGGLYALAPTLERFYYGDILFVEASGQTIPLSDQVDAARAAFPDLALTGLRPAATAAESTRVYFADPSLDEELLRAVFVDPHSGRVLGDEATWLGYLPLSTWLDGLHRHLNLGEPGRVYSEIAASWLWLVALGGGYLWLVKAASERRRKRAGRILTVDRSVTGRSRTLNWHGTTGVWLLGALLFLSATGITWSTYAGAHVTDIRSALNWQRPQLDTAVPGGEHAGHGGAAMRRGQPDVAGVDYDRVLAAAAGAGVHLPLEVTMPAGAGDGLGVAEVEKPYRLTTNAATVDPAGYAVTAQIDYWRDYSVVAKLADWGIRGHMGLLFGLLNQLLLLAVAVGLVTVIVRGYVMWWRRRPTRGSAWAVGRPPMRGGIRRLQPAAIAALIVTTVAVGWFLPLLGITLAGFVAIDLLIGAVKARRAKVAGDA
ncbi:PepSY domain-containing protein [Mycolicibacterium sp. S2-37]|uniref:PepSY-associated TM helix domain-containing protein n=1 Tax=Mycolicibacterium sp. S2-37 TaxID=2810297 RepID=UPI001A9436E0|nr:PepSY domain-containing protein [Mycolicibacterium sp. S2-37]MBO0681269.1 PepSY domain-containing protein [Mycolicibacterium sp. S2-37]